MSMCPSLVAQNGHIEVVKFLTLEMNCDPTCTNADNVSALHLAVVNGHLDIVTFLVSDQYCDPNIPVQYGRTPLHYAAEFGHLHIVKYLVDKQGCIRDSGPNPPDHIEPLIRALHPEGSGGSS